MADHLLQTLEEKLQRLYEKMTMLLTEVEDSRAEIQRLNHENTLMRVERENHAKKLTDLISVLDSIHAADNMASTMMQPAMELVLVEG